MKIRATLHVDGDAKPLMVYPILEETQEHLLLKLAAAVFFHKQAPMVSPSSQHPALRDQDFQPDLLHVDEGNVVRLWIECDKTTLHKMEKVAKRYREARLVTLMANPREAEQLKSSMPDDKWNRWEILAFAEGEFAKWRGLIKESNDFIGEADERTMNLVINEDSFMTELLKIR